MRDPQRIRRELNKIRILMENGHGALVKEAVSKCNGSMSSLRNWLSDERKAITAYDVKKGVLSNIANALPEYQNITRRIVYDFILEEAGINVESQTAISRLYGTYKFVHKVKDFEFRDLVIGHNANSNYPYFFYIMRAPGPGGQLRPRKSDGFVFSTGSMLVLSGVEKRLDTQLYLSLPFDPDNDIMHGLINIHLKDIRTIYVFNIALFKQIPESSRLERKMQQASDQITDQVIKIFSN